MSDDGRFLPARIDPNAPLFTVTVAARLADMHPQTLRGYDRLGLVVPQRSKGRGRRYSPRDVVRLRRVAQLGTEGISLEGIRRILDLEERLEEAHQQVAYLTEVVRAQAVATASGGRLFTAEASGSVHLGRARARPAPRAIGMR